ncbi:MAG: tRNA guanosine(15) transglycosylase TgtA [Methanobacteriota archaeon]|nr:MAG: tRNA guanosine(15) transglycosylase TgtA [Euryarchaeota archaeon]|tara:strand:+ start:2479 stop:4602 length:2124 start_codon:yes stop_codon:yes gene_type:complete
MAERPDPVGCREQDLGLFEITHRDGSARIGRLHTKHGVITTPMLLPVINPNLRTIEPREMWESYGIEALITNSYVIWKHEDLRKEALSNGIHSLLDFPGTVVTDSGTFQSYVYGDVEVDPQEIVSFQRDMGVDIGTMLDEFGRPDMTREELERAVEVTAERSEPALEEAGGNLLLNGPIQGGTHPDLRAHASSLMGDALSGEQGFCVHPIGGIVPLMEQQRYKELFEILLASKASLPPGRPVHLFGCGHPILFPMAIALGVDLFDSAAYAIFARDDRLLTPNGTVKLDNLNEWPLHSNALFGTTPGQLRSMDLDARSEILARHNLEITQAELARCREAIRTGKIWELAEQRSHSSPYLREAFLWVQEQLDDPDHGPVGDSILRLIASTDPLRGGGEALGEDIEYRPHILHIQALLATRWRVPGSWWDSTTGPPKRVVIIQRACPPWRTTSLRTAIWHLVEEPMSVVLINTPIGLIPFPLEDVSPWCHLTGPGGMWELPSDDGEISELLHDLGLSGTTVVRVNPDEEVEIDHSLERKVREWLDRCSIVDKLSLFCAIHPLDGCKLTDGMRTRKSRTDRIVNVYSGDSHVLSPRLTDGGLSLATEGAHSTNNMNSTPAPRFGSPEPEEEFPGIPRVCIHDDAVPFVGKGRNVMHGYILGADSHLIPGQPCLVVDSGGRLIAHGTPITTHFEMASLRKGVAVRVREGVAN